MDDDGAVTSLRGAPGGPRAAGRRQGRGGAAPAPHRGRRVRPAGRHAGAHRPDRAGRRRRAAPRCRSRPGARGPPSSCSTTTTCRTRRSGSTSTRSPRSREPPRRLHRVAAARAVLGVGLGHDPRRRAGHPRLPGAGAVRHRQGVGHRRGAVAAAPGEAGARPLRGPGRGARRAWRAGPTPRCAQLRAAAPGSDHQLAWARAFARRRPHRRAAGPAGRAAGRHRDRSRAWRSTPSCAGRCCERLVGDRPRRRGRRSTPSCERDTTAAGERHAATARAARPTAEAKAEAWASVVEADDAAQRDPGGGHRRLRRRPTSASCWRRTPSKYFAAVKRIWDVPQPRDGASRSSSGSTRRSRSRRPRWTPPTPGWRPRRRPRRCAGWSSSPVPVSSARCAPRRWTARRVPDLPRPAVPGASPHRGGAPGALSGGPGQGGAVRFRAHGSSRVDRPGHAAAGGRRGRGPGRRGIRSAASCGSRR